MNGERYKHKTMCVYNIEIHIHTHKHTHTFHSHNIQYLINITDDMKAL